MNMSRRDFINLKWQTLLVVFICYLPHFITEPWWIFIIFATTLAYRVVADYFSYPLMPRWLRFFFLIACLFLLSQSVTSSEFLIRCLLIFIILKCLEIETIRDIKVLIICNLLLIFSALIVVRVLWIIIYLFIAILADLSIMLKVSAPSATLRQIGGKSSQQLLIAIPISILLFFVFPRIEPLWHIPTFSKASTGFNTTMSPGSIEELYGDDSKAMQISFRQKAILRGYWRGIILNFYDGTVWYPEKSGHTIFSPLPELKAGEIADYEIILEPNQKKWLFYLGYPTAGFSNLAFSPNNGLMRQNNQPITQTFIYSLQVQPAPYHALTPIEYAADTQLPTNINPRLSAWSQQQFSNAQHDVKTFINFLRSYIHQSFWYTLKPPSLSSTNKMDSFWFDTQKGFCEHYASAMAFILRAAGIPARVIIGYRGGQLNPISQVVTIRQNDAHAWIEYWQQGIGWQSLDPTAFIAPERIDPTIQNHEQNLINQGSFFSISGILFPQKLRYYLDSVRFFTERWFLFYNQNTQQDLLANFGLGKWKESRLFQLSLGFIFLFFILLGLFYHRQQRQILDPILIEYHLLQEEFRKFNISTQPPATLKQQCQSLINKDPTLAPLLSTFIDDYEQLRLKQLSENGKKTIMLFKTLRRRLQKEAQA